MVAFDDPQKPSKEKNIARKAVVSALGALERELSTSKLRASLPENTSMRACKDLFELLRRNLAKKSIVFLEQVRREGPDSL